METVKDVSNFCIAAIFFDFKNVGVIGELNQVRKCIFNNFRETIPVSRVLITISIIDVVNIKSHDNDIEKVIEDIHDLGSNILYMIGFEKVVKDDVGKVMNQKDNLLMKLGICYLSI